MDSFLYKDYASWKMENHEVLDTFKSNKNMIYVRFEPVFATLDYIYDQVVEQKEVDEDLETIFSYGFEYLYTQIEVIKVYFDSLFQSKCEEFQEYNEMILFLLYILDIKIDIENNNKEVDLTELDVLEEYIENMIMERSKNFDYVRTRLNKALNAIDAMTDYEYTSVVDIYSEICENLGIFLYEESEFVIGKDI
ncbi:hypothetical protein OAO42_01290 [Candidatus Izimaplasma bacterium]|nr:hypothetical protein [Candidatus Izimaplasma bacterium]